METVQQNGRFTLFSSKFLSMYSILYVSHPNLIPLMLTWQNNLRRRALHRDLTDSV